MYIICRVRLHRVPGGKILEKKIILIDILQLIIFKLLSLEQLMKP